MEQMEKQYHVHYSPAKGWARVDFAELWRYKDLIWLFVKRDFTVMYKQTILGPAWVLINPLLSAAMYTVMFGVIAKLPTDGVPQALFYLAGTALWGFFAACINRVSATFTSNSAIFSKVYFPRLTMPISTMLSAFINFVLQFIMFFGLLLFYTAKGQVHPNWAYMPLTLLLLAQVGLLGLGCGIIVSSLTTRYRDLMVVVGFGVQLWMYGTPVVYPLSMIDGMNRVLHIAMVLNPMTAPMETFRFIFFGTGQVTLRLWAVSLVWTVVLLALGLSLFSKVEKTFVDTV
ncbi:MAG: ABC transporter permease [Gemmiger sp.]|uniref:Transport permease protein n=1 Tax=Subdoligranulum variabile TaxID=214851 RepID=A0A921LMI4_9FIRM|nr:ABC transporter permease [Gemmiger sp.]MEE0707872.1 ABC transporter permease [Gemmiger sp.]HJG27551.1 ABC transporter permease [Subdoligranulum variabile]